MLYLPRFSAIVLDPSVALKSPLHVASPDCATLYSTSEEKLELSFIPVPDAEGRQINIVCFSSYLQARKILSWNYFQIFMKRVFYS